MLVSCYVYYIVTIVVLAMVDATDDMSSQLLWQQPTLDTSRLPASVGDRRDHAACPCGPCSFLVVGGFDGKQEVMDLAMHQVGLASWWAFIATRVELQSACP